jgi:hypothetical protein
MAYGSLREPSARIAADHRLRSRDGAPRTAVASGQMMIS